MIPRYDYNETLLKEFANVLDEPIIFNGYTDRIAQLPWEAAKAAWLYSESVIDWRAESDVLIGDYLDNDSSAYFDADENNEALQEAFQEAIDFENELHIVAYVWSALRVLSEFISVDDQASFNRWESSNVEKVNAYYEPKRAKLKVAIKRQLGLFG